MRIHKYFLAVTIALTLSCSERGLAMGNVLANRSLMAESSVRSSVESMLGSLPELPIEVLAHIFSSFGQEDLLRAGGTCKRWRQGVERVWRNKPLHLSKRRLRQADYKALAQGIFSSLILQKVKLGHEAACVLALCSKLNYLEVNHNQIGPKGTKALASGSLSALTELNLDSNRIGDEGGKALAAGNLYALTTLDLSSNGIGDEGVKAIAHGNFSALTTLDLYLNSIGAEGAKAIAHGNFSALTALNLSYNSIGEEGAKALAQGNLSALTKLDLRRNSIDAEGKEALTKNACLYKITTL